MGKIVVIGAGVSGLTCAVELLRQGHSVTIIARHIPGDLDIEYTSPWAGANWSSFASRDDTFTQEIDKIGYHKLRELADSVPSAGIAHFEEHHYTRKSELDSQGRVPTPWFDTFVEGFKLLAKGEYPELEDIVGGYKFDTVSITVPIYLNYLLQTFFSLGGELKRLEVKHVNDAFYHHASKQKADLVVNCAGLLSRYLGGVEDKTVYPIRGQVLLCRNNATKQVVLSMPEFKDEILYMFPRREGGCIIGGTMIKNQWSGEPDMSLAKRMISRAKKFIPELVDPKLGNPADIEVYRYTVGLRPGREDGVKIEREGNVIHNYGVGGAGYQSSYGLAAKVVKYVSDFYRESKL